MMTRWILTALCALAITAQADTTDRDTHGLPNILWIMAEDTSPWMGCYGDDVNAGHTPNIDALAANGVRFARAFVPAPVCSPCRSAMMGGANQIRFGAHEHRSSRGPVKMALPKGMKLLPQIMKEHGYFTANYGKTDYNFVWNKAATYSTSKTKIKPDSIGQLKDHQPFFVQYQTKGGKNNTSKFPASRRTNPAEVTVPADYPQTQLFRETVAQHYDAIRTDDDVIGRIRKSLKASGLLDNTIVVYFSDHGANNLVRHKQMPTEGGLHVPFIVTGPEKYVPAAGVRNDLVNMLDLPATTLAWAGIDIPRRFEGQNLFAADFKQRDVVYSAKDRLDHTLDRVRSVRSDQFRYTRNYKTDRIFLQPQYRDNRPFLATLHTLYESGKLSPKLKEIYFGERPAEELYDVSKDPHQLNNLVDNPTFVDELNRHRTLLDQWLAKGDMGADEEPVEQMRFNADTKHWGIGVNPEYEVYREDSDGDGLSDIWEKANARDPADGRLLFTFDCGGWQTEGWQADGIDNNIAGFKGFLDFTLQTGKGSIERSGLDIKASEEDKHLAITLRSSEALQLQPSANEKNLGQSLTLDASDDYTTLKVPLDWQGQIASLTLAFTGKDGAFIEIDTIEVVQ